MTSRSPLDTLIEIAVKETDEAAKKLGIAIRFGEETEKKLELLIQYRNEYAARCQSGLTAGINAMSYRNFQAFLEKMDHAVRGQTEIVHNAHQRIAEMRLLWQESERKRMSFNTLVSRAQKKELQRETKLDQKNTDEHASRQAAHKR